MQRGRSMLISARVQTGGSVLVSARVERRVHVERRVCAGLRVQRGGSMLVSARVQSWTSSGCHTPNAMLATPAWQLPSQSFNPGPLSLPQRSVGAYLVRSGAAQKWPWESMVPHASTSLFSFCCVECAGPRETWGASGFLVSLRCYRASHWGYNRPVPPARLPVGGVL